MGLVLNVQSLDRSRLQLASCLQPSHRACQDHNGFIDPFEWKEKDRPKPASWASLHSSRTGLNSQKDLELDLMLCHHSLEILANF